MRVAFLVVAAFLIMSSTFAVQVIGKGYFLYNNLTVGNGQSIFVGVNTTSSVDLIVIPSSGFSSYINGAPVAALYNKNVSTGIYQLNLGPGSFTVITEALQTTNLETGVLVAKTTGGSIVDLNGKYYYNFSLSNYSSVQINLLSSSDYSSNPLAFNISTTSTLIHADTDLDTISLMLNRGQHSMLLNSPGRQQIFVSLNVTPALVNPLPQANNGENHSIGVASYGLYNISGRLYPYQVLTNEVVGVANISALEAYESAPVPDSSADGASLQLNVGLNTYVNNKLRVFWLQDVVAFNTSSRQYYFVDNVWNNTNPDANLTMLGAEGNGNFLSCTTCGNQNFYAYSYPNYYMNYSFPLSVKLVVLENQTPRGSQINFGYQVLRNGTTVLKPLIFFDHVLIPGSSNATLITTPYYETPGGGSSFGNYYDTELVFGGESGGANSYFQQMNASLWIYYNNKSTITPFPSVYTFGLSTAESASGIGTKNSSGVAVVEVGSPDYSLDLFSGNAMEKIAQYVSNTSSYVAPVTTVQSTTNPFSTTNITPSQINTLAIGAGVLIVVALILGFFLLKRT